MNEIYVGSAFKSDFLVGYCFRFRGATGFEA